MARALTPALLLCLAVRSAVADEQECESSDNSLHLLQKNAGMRLQQQSLEAVNVSADPCGTYVVRYLSTEYRPSDDITLYNYDVSCGRAKDISHIDWSNEFWGENDMDGFTLDRTQSTNDAWKVGKDGKHTWPNGAEIWGVKADSPLVCPGARTYTVAFEGRMENCVGKYVVKAGQNFAYCDLDYVPCPKSLCDENAGCVISGDPHITPFDERSASGLSLLSQEQAVGESINDIYGPGDFWLVKSPQIAIQGRFREVHYPGAKYQNRTYLTAVAVSGPNLRDHALIIKPRTGDITWKSLAAKGQAKAGGAKSILASLPSSFDFEDLLSAKSHRRDRVGGGKHRAEHAQTDAVDFRLPSGVRLYVDRFGKHLDIRINMPRPDPHHGIDGQCGNYNGDASDDHAHLIASRFALEVPDTELLL
eukprot:CAMPEP_0178448804 /NCGR_PEP_ID=MMETSP0689_2-20121128/42194_1 /TAXON_ID=160604 /ORGANISM="Amphidinium massartii, Strain CS-259" /LENGTH=419 /DNA_ID=CAMNT_0020074043 /DNA_START=97 /DNA_END=1356 /DNA_ORIENTATION=-